MKLVAVYLAAACGRRAASAGSLAVTLSLETTAPNGNLAVPAAILE
jgi:hypothetical protein